MYQKYVWYWYQPHCKNKYVVFLTMKYWWIWYVFEKPRQNMIPNTERKHLTQKGHKYKRWKRKAEKQMDDWGQMLHKEKQEQKGTKKSISQMKNRYDVYLMKNSRCVIIKLWGWHTQILICALISRYHSYILFWINV